MDQRFRQTSTLACEAVTVSGNRQLSFDELDEPLRVTTFVVVDLETTGGAAGADSITEIGAVKVRGGEVPALVTETGTITYRARVGLP